MSSGALVVATAEFNGQNHVLFGEKKYGRDQGRLVLIGGKEKDPELYDEYPEFSGIGLEHPDHTVLRETQEETGIDLRQANTFIMGALTVEFVDGCIVDDEYVISIYRSILDADYAQTVELTENNEIVPLWLPSDNLPYDRMQPDVPIWLDAVVGYTDRGQLSCLTGSIVYQKRGEGPGYDLANLQIVHGSGRTAVTLTMADYPK